jgi:hypothetical protein
MSVKGIEKLQALEAALRSLSGGSFEAEARTEVVQVAAQETQKTISSGRTPYGSPWPGRAPGLARLRAAAQGSSIVVKHPFAGVHQAGATITGKMRFKSSLGWRRSTKVTIPRRQLVPEGKLPDKWRPAIKRAVVAAVRARLKV